ncbi:MAG: hypothetical protein CBB65_09365 [Hyphomonadaceae bacterium TMED5]|nr:hypothetical protein [Ponticaulis sp.]OUX99148.1 MAG: hypothetical protein CBB65_09365 [Hyphomonadaceae bacterium TMED5]
MLGGQFGKWATVIEVSQTISWVELTRWLALEQAAAESPKSVAQLDARMCCTYIEYRSQEG